MSRHKEYDYLVAAHLLRRTEMAGLFGPMLARVEWRFFEDFFLRDVVSHGVKHYLDTGHLLPKESLKVDAALFGREGASQDNYDLEIDRAFRVPEESLDKSTMHVRRNLVEEVQARLLVSADLQGLAAPATLGRLYATLDEIRSLGVSENGEAKRLSESLLETLKNPPRGIPTGIEELDSILSAGGVAPGECLLLYGRYSIGKSMLEAHSVRHAAQNDFVALHWAVGDGSQKTLEMRHAKGLLGWTDQQIRSDPARAVKAFEAAFGDLPLYLSWTPASRTTRADILRRIDRIEQKEGRKLDLLAMDYSEKRSAGRDWNQVCDSYSEFQDVCGEKGIAGIDAAQENQNGTISYFNLLKDADVGIQLTITPPADWRRSQKSKWKVDEESVVTVPKKGPLYGEVVRCREGESGAVFELWVDRETGLIRPRRKGEFEG